MKHQHLQPKGFLLPLSPDNPFDSEWLASLLDINNVLGTAKLLPTEIEFIIKDS